MKTFPDSVFQSPDWVNRVADSINSSHINSFSSVSSGHTLPVGSFFGAGHLKFSIHQIISTSDSWIFYSLFASLALLAILRYFFPVPLAKLFSFSSHVKMMNSDENNKATSGILAPLFLFLNFLIGSGLLIVAVTKIYAVTPLSLSTSFRFFAVLVLLILTFYFSKQLLVLLAGFIFDTGNDAMQHVQTNTTTAYFAGLFLSPLMLIYFYTQLKIFIYLALLIFLMLGLMKWVQIIKIGLSDGKLKALHIFLYLCTVEFLPLLLLMKVGVEQLKLI